MGRPVKRDVTGTLVFGNYENPDSNVGIKVSARIPTFSTAKAAFIVKQTGSRSYRVTNADGTGKCVLVASITAAGQMVMTGFTNQGQAADTGAVAIRKLNKRTATDFNNNRYTWLLVNDSSEDYIQLTLISDGNS